MIIQFSTGNTNHSMLVFSAQQLKNLLCRSLFQPNYYSQSSRNFCGQLGHKMRNKKALQTTFVLTTLFHLLIQLLLPLTTISTALATSNMMQFDHSDCDCSAIKPTFLRSSGIVIAIIQKSVTALSSAICPQLKCHSVEFKVSRKLVVLQKQHFHVRC